MIPQRAIAMPIRLSRACAAASVLLMPHLMRAQTDRTHAPQPGPPPTVRVAEPEETTLPNGLRVITVENHKLPVVSVQVRFDHPPVAQGELAGYQDLMGELLTAGTVRRTKEQLDEDVDKLGAQLHGSSDGLFASGLKRNLPELMRIVYEVLTAPMFPPAEFEKARTRYLSGLKMRPEDPDQIADAAGRALTYTKKHPYGEVATEATVGKITRANLVAYYERFFRPQDGYLVFVGDITGAEAVELATRLFGTWTGAKVDSDIGPDGTETVKNLGLVSFTAARPEAKLPRQVAFVDRPGSAQSVIRVGFPLALEPKDPDALAAQVLNTILGGGVFNARLMQNLREKHAFTYGAYSQLDADRWCGAFSAGCSVRNAVTDSAVTEIMREIQRIREEPVTAEELSLAKSYMAGSFARSLEDPRTIARFALNTRLFGLKPDHYATYLQRLDTVSAATVLAVAKRLLKPDNATILVVGDKQEVANKLTGLGAQKVIHYFDANGDPYRETAALPAKDRTAQMVLDAYVKAIGGADRLSRVKSLKKVYEAEMGGMAITLTELFVAPRNYAMSMASGPMVMQRLVYDGTRGEKSGADPAVALVDQELEDARQSSYPFPELAYKELDYGAVLNGVVEIDGRQCDRIFVKKSAGGVFTEYYDQATGLKVRRTETQNAEQGTMQVTTDFKDYKEHDGILFPETIEQNLGAHVRFTATAIEVNGPIPAAEFKMMD